MITEHTLGRRKLKETSNPSLCEIEILDENYNPTGEFCLCWEMGNLAFVLEWKPGNSCYASIHTDSFSMDDEAHPEKTYSFYFSLDAIDPASGDYVSYETIENGETKTKGYFSGNATLKPKPGTKFRELIGELESKCADDILRQAKNAGLAVGELGSIFIDGMEEEDDGTILIYWGT